MNNRTILCLIYLSTFAVLSFGQQSAAIASRTPDAAQLLEVQGGEVEFFKTIVYRYEVAWEESDVQSMIDLRTGLTKLMAVEIKQLAEKLEPSKGDTDRLAQELAILKKVEATPISLNDPALGKLAELNKDYFNDFIRLLEADYTEQASAIRN